MTTPDVAPAIASADPPAPAPCRNCGTPMLGPHCYACGQPVKGLVRPLGNLFGDLLDSVFNIDARIVRTLGPLFARPGLLTTEYFAGRQVRYVTPVRLFFFLCILAFFVARLSIDRGDSMQLNINDDGGDDIGAAMTEAELLARRDAALKRMDEAIARIPQGPGHAGATSGLRAGRAQVQRSADSRLQQLRDAAAKGVPPPAAEPDGFNFGDKPWDAKTNPLRIPAAPAFVEAWVNDKIGRAKHNVARIKADPSAYTEAFVAAIPTALFVLVPLFALLLKIAYLFKRRLYMEHLVVALHSHAFISLVLLMVFGCAALQRLVVEGGGVHGALGLCIGLLLTWLPINLLLTQKRVYAQGWPMTLLKYFVLGTIYVVLLSLAIAAAAAASLVWM
jgi:hypothetical protein